MLYSPLDVSAGHCLCVRAEENVNVLKAKVFTSCPDQRLLDSKAATLGRGFHPLNFNANILCFIQNNRQWTRLSARFIEGQIPDLFFCPRSGCYGISADEGELDDWLCARCEANATTVVSAQCKHKTQFEPDQTAASGVDKRRCIKKIINKKLLK